MGKKFREPQIMKAKVYRASQLETYPIPFEIVEFVGFTHFFMWQRQQNSEVIILAQKYCIRAETGISDYRMWSSKRGYPFLRALDNCHCALMLLDVEFWEGEKSGNKNP